MSASSLTDPSHPARGRLKIYLGYAAGVGKTYQMLDEAQTLQRQGRDVAIGYFEPHGRKDTIAKTQGLEMVPRRSIEYRGSTFEEMNVPAILTRRPEICLVDELPHTNVPGAERAKRWEDVIALLEAGIDVFSTINVQHLESLYDQVLQITGIRVRETVPDWVLRQADEVVMVDLTPRALLNRLMRGAVYPSDKARRAMDFFFKESTLVALRELALRETAHEVNVRVVDMASRLPRAPSASVGGGERLLVFVTEVEGAEALVRRARRVADFLGAECYAVYVRAAQQVERAVALARVLHIETRELEGDDHAQALVEFARAHKVTHIFVGRPRYDGVHWFTGRNLIHRIVRLAKEMEVIVVAERRAPAPG
jgi:two-component system, OmpR family, sensor histidine kinase KdpD